MAGPGADDAGEVCRAVTGAVVGDDAVDVGDAVGGEPDLGSGQERGQLSCPSRRRVARCWPAVRTRRSSSASTRSPAVAPAVLAWSTARCWSLSRPWMRQPAQGIELNRRTVTRHLTRLGLGHRRFLDSSGDSNRQLGKIIARWPGHMVHVDVKKVGRIPDGGAGGSAFGPVLRRRPVESPRRAVSKSGPLATELSSTRCRRPWIGPHATCLVAISQGEPVQGSPPPHCSSALARPGVGGRGCWRG